MPNQKVYRKEGEGEEERSTEKKDIMKKKKCVQKKGYYPGKQQSMLIYT